MPVLFYGARRVDNSAVHVKEEAMEICPYGRCRIVHNCVLNARRECSDVEKLAISHTSCLGRNGHGGELVIY